MELFDNTKSKIDSLHFINAVIQNPMDLSIEEVKEWNETAEEMVGDLLNNTNKIHNYLLAKAFEQKIEKVSRRRLDEDSQNMELQELVLSESNGKAVEFAYKYVDKEKWVVHFIFFNFKSDSIWVYLLKAISKEDYLRYGKKQKGDMDKKNFEYWILDLSTVAKEFAENLEF